MSATRRAAILDRFEYLKGRPSSYFFDDFGQNGSAYDSDAGLVDRSWQMRLLHTTQEIYRRLKRLNERSPDHHAKKDLKNDESSFTEHIQGMRSWSCQTCVCLLSDM